MNHRGWACLPVECTWSCFVEAYLRTVWFWGSVCWGEGGVAEAAKHIQSIEWGYSRAMAFSNSCSIPSESWLPTQHIQVHCGLFYPDIALSFDDHISAPPSLAFVSLQRLLSACWCAYLLTVGLHPPCVSLWPHLQLAFSMNVCHLRSMAYSIGHASESRMAPNQQNPGNSPRRLSNSTGPLIRCMTQWDTFLLFFQLCRHTFVGDMKASPGLQCVDSHGGCQPKTRLCAILLKGVCGLVRADGASSGDHGTAASDQQRSGWAHGGSPEGHNGSQPITGMAARLCNALSVAAESPASFLPRARSPEKTWSLCGRHVACSDV